MYTGIEEKSLRCLEPILIRNNRLGSGTYDVASRSCGMLSLKRIASLKKEHLVANELQ